MHEKTLYQQAIELKREKGIAEVRRHAHVSIDNRHYCQTCFTCACLDVLCQFTAGGYERFRDAR